MKATLVSFFILFLCSNSNAQVWGHAGATWHYDYGLFSGGLSTIEYVGDTTISNYTAQKLEVTYQEIYPQQNGTTILGPSYTSNYFTRYSGDSVFWYTQGQFYLLYDFGASPGDSWVIQETTSPGFLCDSTSVVEVVDAGTVQINGQSLRYIDMRYVQGDLGMSGRAIERIGMVEAYNPEISYLFPQYQNCDSNQVVDFSLYHFRCYQDDNYSAYNVTSQTCDYPVATASLQELSQGQKNVVTMVDLLGREVKNPENEMIIILYSDGSTEKKFVD